MALPGRLRRALGTRERLPGRPGPGPERPPGAQRGAALAAEIAAVTGLALPAYAVAAAAGGVEAAVVGASCTLLFGPDASGRVRIAWRGNVQ